MSESIFEADIVHEMRDSYMEYAMSVIVGRALPDVRDGLKPVHRRVLFSMSEQGNEYNKPYRKSANVVGDVMGEIPSARRRSDLRHCCPTFSGFFNALPAN